MPRDGIPLPLSLDGSSDTRSITLDRALFYLVIGALVELVDNWKFEQTGTLTVEEAKDLLNDALTDFMGV